MVKGEEEGDRKEGEGNVEPISNYRLNPGRPKVWSKSAILTEEQLIINLITSINYSPYQSYSTKARGYSMRGKVHSCLLARPLQERGRATSSLPPYHNSGVCNNWQSLELQNAPGKRNMNQG